MGGSVDKLEVQIRELARDLTGKAPGRKTIDGIIAGPAKVFSLGGVLKALQRATGFPPDVRAGWEFEKLVIHGADFKFQPGKVPHSVSEDEWVGGQRSTWYRDAKRVVDQIIARNGRIRLSG